MRRAIAKLLSTALARPNFNRGEPEMKPDTAPSIRTVARREGIDLGLLLNILSRKRPYDTPGEEAFIEEFLDHIEGMQRDEFGNRWIVVGKDPTVMWSCHTDTVSAKDGFQNLRWKEDTLELNEGKPGQCLGADDGAGMWLLLQMLEAGKEGLYIFHRAEEVGRLGSKWIDKNNRDLIKDIKIAIAFDRRATHSIITHQSGARCCSEDFAKEFARRLNEAVDGFKYETDPTGSYTDTATYTDTIPECTNVSVGYYSEHGPRETLDVAHLVKLREAMLKIEVADLPVERDPTEVEWDDYTYSWGGYSTKSSSSGLAPVVSDKELAAYNQMLAVVEKYPMAVTALLQDFDYDARSLEDDVFDAAKYIPYGAGVKTLQRQSFPSDEPLSDDWDMWCRDCDSVFISDLRYPTPGEACHNCFSNNTESLYEYSV